MERAVDVNKLEAHGEKRKTGQVVTYSDFSENSDSDSITAPVFACLCCYVSAATAASYVALNDAVRPIYHTLSPIHTADADATQLSSRVGIGGVY